MVSSTARAVRPHRVDYAGSLLTVRISALIFAGDDRRPAAGRNRGTGVTSLFAIAALVVHERRAAEPMLPLAIFNRVVVAGAAGSFMLGMLVMVAAFSAAARAGRDA